MENRLVEVKANPAPLHVVVLVEYVRVVTFYAPKKALYDIDPSGLRTAGIALTLFTAAISLLPGEDDQSYIQEIETLDAADEPLNTIPVPPNEKSPLIWGGTRLGQWVVMERAVSLLVTRKLVDQNTELVVDHGNFSCDLYISDLPSGRLSRPLHEIATRLIEDITSRRGGYVLGKPRVLPLCERPMFRDPYPSTIRKLVMRKLRGETVPIPFSEKELSRILYADVSRPGVLKSLELLRPHVLGRFFLEMHKFGLATVSVRILESDNYDVIDECDWFERVFPELIPPGVDVQVQPATSLPRVGLSDLMNS